MKIKTLLTAAMLTVGMSAAAQATYVDAEGTTYTFQKHLFLDVEGGLQYTLGEAKFKDLLSPNVQLGLGYQLNPWFAPRLQVNAWQSKGGWNGFHNDWVQTPYTADYKYKYVAPGVDFMFNLSNLICGYNPMRVFNVTAFLGGGANIAWGNDEANDIAHTIGQVNLAHYNLEYVWDGTKVRPFGRGGIELGFRLSDAIQLNVEGNANIIGDKYNSKKADNADWYFNALIGLRINLGQTYTKQAKELPPPPPPVEVVEITEPEPEKVEPPKPVKIEPIRQDIFFELNKWVIRPSEEGKIRAIAEYLNKYEKANVALTGYADVETGNDRINDKLSENRANVVKDALVNQYGISVSRIKIDWKGSRVQPFPTENDKNRVTIAIAE